MSREKVASCLESPGETATPHAGLSPYIVRIDKSISLSRLCEWCVSVSFRKLSKTHLQVLAGRSWEDQAFAQL